MNTGTITLTLDYEEYRALAAMAVTSGDSLMLALMSGDLNDERAAIAGPLLGLVTSIIEKLTVARDAAGWGDRVDEAAVN